MARKQFSGEGRVSVVTTIANRAAPTVAELNAGVDVTAQLAGDGIPNIPMEGSTVDISDAASLFNKTAPGTFGGQPLEMILYRDSVGGSETGWAALARGTAVHIVIRRFGGSTLAWATSQKVEVAKGTVLTRESMKPARNEVEKYRVQISVEEIPEQDATTA
jgi:hypothetical protein